MFDDCYFDEHKLNRRKTLLHDRNLRENLLCGPYDPKHFMHQNYETKALSIVQKLPLQVCKVDFEEIDDTFVSKKPEDIIPIKKCENRNFDISLEKDFDLLWISLDTVATVEETWEDGVWAVVKTNCLEITEKKISKTLANTNRFVGVNHKFLLSLTLGRQIPYLKLSCRASNVIYKGITFEYGEIITINIRRKIDKEPSANCKEKPKGKKRSACKEKDVELTCETDSDGNKRWKLNGQLHRTDGPAIEFANGDKVWYINGKCHRIDGPAVEFADGSKYWYVNGEKLTKTEFNEKVKKLKTQPTCEIDVDGTKRWKLNGKYHRTDGPACEFVSGSKSWYVNGKRHRTDGPAVEYVNGHKGWYVNGECHRLDGPAVEFVNGSKEWWIDGEKLTETEFNEKIKELKSKDKPTCKKDIYGNKEWKNDDGLLHRLDGPAVEHLNGKHWWVDGKRHRTDGPASECANRTKAWYINGEQLTEQEFNKEVEKLKSEIDVGGTKRWKLNGKYHRLDGPAIEYTNGDKSWYINNKLHRIDGPAIEYVNGHKEWYVNGKCHRLDGPAVEFVNGRKEWWIDGEKLTETEFNEKVKKLKTQPTSEIDLFVPELNTDILIEPLYNTYVNVLKGKQVKITVDSSLYHVSQTCHSFTFQNEGDKFTKIYTLDRVSDFYLNNEWFYLNPITKKKHKIGVCFSAINKDGYMIIEDPTEISEILAFDVRGFVIKSKDFINIEIVKGLSAAISYTQEKDNGFETLIHTNNVNRFILKKNKKNWKLTS